MMREVFIAAAQDPPAGGLGERELASCYQVVVECL